MKEITFGHYEANGIRVIGFDGSRSYLRSPKGYSPTFEIEVVNTIYYYSFSFWGSSGKLYDDSKTLLTIEKSSNGDAIFFVDDETDKTIYRFVSFGSSSVLKNVKGKELIVLNSRFSWKELWNVTTLLCDEDFANTIRGKILLLLYLHHHYSRE